MPQEPLHSGLMRESEILAEFPFSRITLARLVRFGQFPRPVRLAPNTKVWFRDDILGWLAHHRQEVQQ